MITPEDVKRFPDLCDAEAERLGLDFDVRLGKAIEDWRRYVEARNDTRLARGLKRPARKRVDAGSIMLTLASIFAVVTAVAVVVSPADVAKLIGAGV